MADQIRYTKWLEGQLERWSGEGIIGQAQADAIRGLYPARQEGRPWALILFSSLGAVIIGLGVILLFAYNWQYISKFTKLGIIFFALITSHTVGMVLFLRTERLRQLGEAVSVLGTMFFGAGIWLIAQIYHIQEHFPTAFLVWGLGALLLAWVMPSVIQGIAGVVLLTIWTVSEATEYGYMTHWVFVPIILAGVLAYMRRSVILLAVVVVGLGVSAGFLAGICRGAYRDELLVIGVLLSVAAAITGLGLVNSRYGIFTESAGVLHFLGYSAYLVILYVLTFQEFGKGLSDDRWRGGRDWECVSHIVIPVLAVIAGWIAVGMSFLGRYRKARPVNFAYDLFLVPLVPICYYYFYYYFAFVPRKEVFVWAMVAVFNLVFLAHATNMMLRGCRAGSFGVCAAGSLLLVALTIGRYIDLFENLLTRGIIFIIVGVLLFGQGVLFVRMKKKKVERQP